MLLERLKIALVVTLLMHLAIFVNRSNKKVTYTFVNSPIGFEPGSNPKRAKKGSKSRFVKVSRCNPTNRHAPNPAPPRHGRTTPLATHIDQPGTWGHCWGGGAIAGAKEHKFPKINYNDKLVRPSATGQVAALCGRTTPSAWTSSPGLSVPRPLAVTSGAADIPLTRLHKKYVTM